MGRKGGDCVRKAELKITVFSRLNARPRIIAVSNKRRVYRAEFKINASGVYSRYRRLFEVPAFIRDGYIKGTMSRYFHSLF